MKFRFTILLFSTNHITGNLVFLKMKAYGHKVFQADSTESVKKFLQNENLDLLVVDGIETSIKDLHSSISQSGLPVLYVGKETVANLDLAKVSINLNFSEEEFLHKISYLTEAGDSRAERSVHDTVIQHYSGDLDLAQKVVQSFLGSWQSSIEEINKSFLSDDDKVLAAKIHSFKGVLSALGETEAAAVVKKIEILVKGRRRENAHEMFAHLHETCQSLVQELKSSTIVN